MMMQMLTNSSVDYIRIHRLCTGVRIAEILIKYKFFLKKNKGSIPKLIMFVHKHFCLTSDLNKAKLEL